MTPTQQFIQDAIAGGWKLDEIDRCTIHFIHENANDGAKDCFVIDNSYTDSVTGDRHDIAKHYSIGDILLDPLAWQAVGRTRGWTEGVISMWKGYALMFMSKINDGKTIDEALAAIEKGI